ncbi:unnamed protein product [Heligmosomoides polygyrus]|uniref:DNA_ligase_A_N domain-containing protein n=1 Tax=Heligmosomoides polygyrus TaxID=6339 RepID=A0A3P8BQ67_HELPZ|nr:unnamed protein product [Heligmosomoides polygyrus]
MSMVLFRGVDHEFFTPSAFSLDPRAVAHNAYSVHVRLVCRRSSTGAAQIVIISGQRQQRRSATARRYRCWQRVEQLDDRFRLATSVLCVGVARSETLRRNARRMLLCAMQTEDYEALAGLPLRNGLLSDQRKFRLCTRSLSHFFLTGINLGRTDDLRGEELVEWLRLHSSAEIRGKVEENVADGLRAAGLYRRLVDSIYPRAITDGLISSNMQKLIFYAISHPEKLERIGEYLVLRMSRDLGRMRYVQVKLILGIFGLQGLTECSSLLRTSSVFTDDPPRSTCDSPIKIRSLVAALNVMLFFKVPGSIVGYPTPASILNLICYLL